MIRELDDRTVTACAFCGAPARPAMTRCRVCTRPLRPSPNGDGAAAPKPNFDAVGLAEMLELADDYLPETPGRDSNGPPPSLVSPTGRRPPSEMARPGTKVGPGESSSKQGDPLMSSRKASSSPVDRPAGPSTSAVAAHATTSAEGDGKTVDQTPPAEHEIVRLQCDCGRQLRVKAGRAGKRIRCPKCEKTIDVPGAGSSATEADDGETRRFRRIAAELQSEYTAPAPLAKRTLNRWKLRRISAALATTNDGSTGAIEDRCAAVAALGQSRDVRAFELLVPALEDPAAKVREAAVLALGECGDPRAVPRLIALLDPETLSLHRAALTSLAKFADRRVVRPILQYAITAPHARVLVAEAMTELGEAAIPPLLEIVNDPDGGMPLEAIVLLGRLGDKRAVKALIQVIEIRSAVYRAHAAEALGAIGDGRAVASLLPLLRDPEVSVRAAAAAALVKLPDPNAVPALIEALDGDEEHIQLNVIAALGEIGDKRAAEPLRRQLEGASPPVRVAAAEALGQIGDERAVEPLLSMIQDADESIQLKAIAALRRLRDPRAADALLKMLDHPNDVVRQRVVDTLGQIGDGPIAERLESMLRTDRSEIVRVAVAKALGDIRDPASIDALQDALHDDFSVRCRAVISLGAIGDEAALPALMAMLKDPTPEARYHAAGAIAEIGHADSRKALEPLLEDSVTLVRRGAAKALQKLGDERGEQLVKVAAGRQLKRAAAGVVGAFVPNTLVALLWPDSSRARAMLGGGVLAIAGVVGLIVLAPWQGGPSQIVIRGNVASMAVSADAKQLVLGRSRGLIEIYDLAEKSLTRSIPTDLGAVECISVGPSATDLFGASKTNVRFFKENVPQALASGHKSPMEAFRRSPDQLALVSYDRAGLTTIWDLKTPAATGALQLPRGLATIAVSSNGTHVAGAADQKCTVWDAATASVSVEHTAAAPIVSLTFGSGSTELIAGLSDGRLQVFTPQGAVLLPAPEPALPAAALQFATRTNRLVATMGRRLIVWDAAAKDQPPRSIDTKVDIGILTLSADGTRAFVANPEESGVVQVDLATGTLAELAK